MPQRVYRLKVTATAARALSESLPEAVAAAVLEFLQGELLREPRRVSHELQRELAGIWSARRGTYRVLYEINEHEHPEPVEGEEVEVGVVIVVDINHRRDVYRRR